MYLHFNLFSCLFTLLISCLFTFYIFFSDFDDSDQHLNPENEDEDDQEEDFDKIKLEVDPSDFNDEEDITSDITSDFITSDQKDPQSDYQCYHCGKIISTLEKVKEHISEIHKCPPRRYGEPRPYNCIHCGAAFEKGKIVFCLHFFSCQLTVGQKI